MAIVFITGGNKGLGYETAKRLLHMGHKVYIGSRNEERGIAAAKELGAEVVRIDVTNDASVKEAAEYLAGKEEHIDVLINNAGVSGVFKKAEAITAGDMESLYDTNVFGVVRVTNALIPMLTKSDNPVIVNVSSGLGSFGTVTDSSTDESKINSLTYCSSKTAVSMLTLQYAKGLPDIKVNCADPGSTATDLNCGRGKDGPTGTFFNRFGLVPW